MNPQYWLRDRAIGGSTIGALVWLGSCSWRRFTVDNLGKLFGNKMRRLQWSDNMLPSMSDFRTKCTEHSYSTWMERKTQLLFWYTHGTFCVCLLFLCVWLAFCPFCSRCYLHNSTFCFFLHWLLRCLYSCTMNLKKVASSCDSTSPLVCLPLVLFTISCQIQDSY